MSLILTVDGDRWRRHLRQVADDNPGLVPVAKGNGYGFGLGRLARKAEWLGVDTLAVGTYEELPQVAQRFSGDLLVLTPWRPTGLVPAEDLPPGRVIHTVSRLADLMVLLDRDPQARIVLERLTSMRRHGMSAEELRAAAKLLESADPLASRASRSTCPWPPAPTSPRWSTWSTTWSRPSCPRARCGSAT